MKTRTWFLLILGLLISTSKTFATGASGELEIVNIGCHTYDKTCFLTFSGEPLGPETCKSNTVRWLLSDPNGEAAFSHFTAAHLANRKIRLNFATTCFAAKPNYPTFNFWYLI